MWLNFMAQTLQFIPKKVVMTTIIAFLERHQTINLVLYCCVLIFFSAFTSYFLFIFALTANWHSTELKETQTQLLKSPSTTMETNSMKKTQTFSKKNANCKHFPFSLRTLCTEASLWYFFSVLFSSSRSSWKFHE